ncbi:hypothetical protein [Burkholderia cepacia]|uniref:hypothetical protein n=1 Tax=Burkholderia cepacia TaxID=292 RepID=UPI0015884D9E|nr:hypothetical protein [Burkholderia cepacia]
MSYMTVRNHARQAETEANSGNDTAAVAALAQAVQALARAIEEDMRKIKQDIDHLQSRIR